MAQAPSSLPPAGGHCPQRSGLPGGVRQCGPTQPLCDVTVEQGQSLANSAAYTVTVAPRRTKYFQALTCLIVVLDATASRTAGVDLVYNVEINEQAQEAFSQGTSTIGVPTTYWFRDDGYGTPVPWGIHSESNEIHTLVLSFGFIDDANNDTYVVCAGNAFDVLPASMTPGQPFIKV